MAESLPTTTARSCLSKLLFLVLLASLCGLSFAVIQTFRAQDLSDIGGYNLPDTAPKPRDLKLVLKNSIDRDYPLTLSEIEINAWLAATLVPKQGGGMSDNVTLKRVWVRLEDGRAEVIMEREIGGMPFTVSMYFQVERVEGPEGVTTEIEMHGGRFLKDYAQPTIGGRFGRLTVPQGFLLLVMPSYKKLAEQFTEEIDLAFSDMSKIRFEKGALQLDPRQTTGNQGMPKKF